MQITATPATPSKAFDTDAAKALRREPPMQGAGFAQCLREQALARSRETRDSRPAEATRARAGEPRTSAREPAARSTAANADAAPEAAVHDVAAEHEDGPAASAPSEAAAQPVPPAAGPAPCAASPTPPAAPPGAAACLAAALADAAGGGTSALDATPGGAVRRASHATPGTGSSWLAGAAYLTRLQAGASTGGGPHASEPGAAAATRELATLAPAREALHVERDAATLAVPPRTLEAAALPGPPVASLAVPGVPARAGADPAAPPLRGEPHALFESRLAAPVSSAEFGPALGLSLSRLARDGVQAARLQLHPAEMGPIDVRIALDGSFAHVDFHASAAGTRAALEAALPELAAALLDAGLTLGGGGVFEQRDPGAGRERQAEAGHTAPNGLATSRGNLASGQNDPRHAAPRLGATQALLDLYA